MIPRRRWNVWWEDPTGAPVCGGSVPADVLEVFGPLTRRRASYWEWRGRVFGWKVYP